VTSDCNSGKHSLTQLCTFTLEEICRPQMLCTAAAALVVRHVCFCCISGRLPRQNCSSRAPVAPGSVINWDVIN